MARSQLTFRQAARGGALFVAWLFVIEAVDLLLRASRGVTLDSLGIQPRTQSGLIGIACAPLLHAHWPHLLANALPLLILLTLVLSDRRYRPILTLGTIWIISGLGTWLIGRPGSIHIGASSLIFGLVAYLLVAGVFMRSWRSAGVALLVFLAFGGIFYGVMPQPGPISWEGHLSGALAGAWTAWRQHL